MKRFLSRLELISLTYFAVWLVVASSGLVSTQISMWKWDTEVHSTSFWITSQASEPLVSARYPVAPGLTIPRFSEAATRFGDQEVIPYLSTPAFSGWIVAGIAKAIEGLQSPHLNTVAISYGTSIVFSFFVWWVFIHNLRKLVGIKTAFSVFIVFASSLWFLADLTSIHWSPMVRFAPVFFVPLFIQLFRSGRKTFAIGLGAASVLLGAGNGFELLGFALCAALTFLLVITRDSRAIGTYLASLSLGILASALSWLGSLSLRLEGGFQAAVSHVLFTAAKHGTNQRLEAPEGAVVQSEPANVAEALSTLLLGTSPFLPDTERPGLTIIVGVVITLTSSVVFLAVALGRAFLIYGKQKPDLIAVVSAILANLLIIIAMKNYAVNHAHILAIFGLFSFALPAVVMKREKD